MDENSQLLHSRLGTQLSQNQEQSEIFESAYSALDKSHFFTLDSTKQSKNQIIQNLHLLQLLLC